jgi:PIN domain nuclease of toxin-antitoxin system
VLAHLGQEPGSERAEEFFGDALLSAINHAEVVTKLVERGADLPLIRTALARYGIEIVAFEEDQAERAGALRAETRGLGLSLGDRACIALAIRFALPVLTADKMWKALDLPIEVQLLR